MTDQAIIQTLAEFMGMTLPEAMPDGYQSCPLWLESYDALAPIWRKLSDGARRVDGLIGCGKPTEGDFVFHEVESAAHALLQQAAGSGSYLSVWHRLGPRYHAEALATAIQEATK